MIDTQPHPSQGPPTHPTGGPSGHLRHHPTVPHHKPHPAHQPPPHARGGAVAKKHHPVKHHPVSKPTPATKKSAPRFDLILEDAEAMPLFWEYTAGLVH